ncbi:hypothetical protein L3049_17470 [Labilibaculum sp. DW002]|uniref:G domain-containing protein n=1 Tax=Paralabilibaculum antarcticum TaxID=2912572 RepID=A0ABT5VWI6_9BACT|nr:hypothetical protein [Labilibaculum sp. DW002]MDE5419783.1 hypothetical protein [Labilibaculum sp. DW002]
MMNIIVLQGLSNSGKSTTIGLVYELLLSDGGISTNRQPLGGDPKDFSDIVINYKNLKIGFFSMGDNSNALSIAMDEYNSINCDLFICSLSTATKKIRANKKIDKFSSKRIDKTLANNIVTESQANKNDADLIFNII